MMEPSAQDAVEAKTINKFEKAARDINGRKVHQQLLSGKKKKRRENES